MEHRTESGVFVHETARVDDLESVGAGTKIWHYSHVMQGARVGKNCRLGQNVFVAAMVRIGDNVKIQNNVSLYDGVELEDDVFVGPSAVFTNVRIPRAFIARNDATHRGKTIVRKGATIGANSTIVCGPAIGRYAFVGAGAVVTGDVPDFGLILGNPGRLSGWRCICGEGLAFERDDARCPACARVYRIFDGKAQQVSISGR